MWRKHLFGIGLLALIVLGWILLNPFRPLISDKKLIADFYQHRESFEKIVQMANEDSNVISIDENYVSLEGYNIWKNDSQKGFSTKRWNEYRNLFDHLGSNYFHRISKKGDILEINSASIAVKRLEEPESIVISKGYAYSLKEPSRLVDSLGEFGFETSGTYYKKIEGNWYLYFDSGISKPE